MMTASVVLLVVGALLLGVGWVSGSDSMIFGSIAATLVSALLLIASILRDRRRLAPAGVVAAGAGAPAPLGVLLGGEAELPAEEEEEEEEEEAVFAPPTRPRATPRKRAAVKPKAAAKRAAPKPKTTARHPAPKAKAAAKKVTTRSAVVVAPEEKPARRGKPKASARAAKRK